MSKADNPQDLEAGVQSVLDYIDSLDKDSQQAALLDLEKATAGTPLMTLPEPLRTQPREVLIHAAVALRNKVARATGRL